MSYRYLAWAVEQDGGSTHAFAILCALAGYANENGECWPSQSVLAKKTKQTDRSVRNQLQMLIETGHIKRALVAGRHGLRLVMDRNSVPSERNGIPNLGNENPEPCSKAEEARSKPKEPPSGPTEPVKKSVKKQEKKTPAEPVLVDLPEWMPQETWREYLDYRVRAKVGASPYALKLAIRKLNELREQGSDPAAVMDTAILRGWKGGLYPVKGETYGKSTNNEKPHSPHANLFAGFGITDLE